MAEQMVERLADPTAVNWADLMVEYLAALTVDQMVALTEHLLVVH